MLSIAISPEEHTKLIYQPIFNREQKIAKCEVLTRITNDRANTTIQDFVCWIEEAELTCNLDKVNFDRVFKSIKTFLDYKKDIIYSINVSPNSLIKDDFSTTIQNLSNNIKNLDVQVEIEILESYCGVDIKDKLIFIKELGFMISIDDFGGGFDSILKLTEVNYDNVKIDGSLIDRVGYCDKTLIVIKHIIKLAHDLGLNVTAEKIENREQFEFLLKADCDYFQGYYFSRPISKEDYINLLKKYN